MSETLMAKEPYVSSSTQETRLLGSRFAKKLKERKIVALYGTLGAGKTEFVKGVCEGLGIDESMVNSPTFTLVNEYNSGGQVVYHFDAYRLKSIYEFYELGYHDYFFGDGVCLIEWPDRVEELLPEDIWRIQFTHLGEDKRELLLMDE